MDFEYCIIHSQHCNMVLDVDGQNENPGASVIIWNKHGRNNQLWYQDPSTGTIRSKLNDFCLDLEGGQIVLNPLRAGNGNQQWVYRDGIIRNRKEEGKVLQISNGSNEACSNIEPSQYDGSPFQLWNLEPTGTFATHAKPKLFYIVSELNEKLVDIEAASPEENAKVVMWRKDNNEQLLNQLWYFDTEGCIRSALNRMVFTREESGKKLKMAVYRDDGDNGLFQWRMAEGEKAILNGKGHCLNIMGDNGDDGATLCSYKYKNKLNQHWIIEYV